MMSYLHTKFYDKWIGSGRGVAMTRFWDGWTDRQTDGVTRLLDLLSPLATQVKKELSHLSEGRSSLKETNELPSTHKEVNKCH